MSNNKPYWVIYSRKKNAIWQGPFFAHQLAQQELIKQTTLLSENQQMLSDWALETHWRKVNKDESERDEVIKQFDNF